ncbi:MAG: PTS sugar transporter subunit IIC [Planctomycetes bacterium]|nr:PTS sugar transporter subunit IIC [Planctomycetota bacterium]
MTSDAAAEEGTRRARLAAFADRLAREPHLVAVRDGVVAALPLVLIGSFFLLLAQPPSARLQAWVAETKLADGRSLLSVLLVPQRMLTGLIAVYVCFGAARSLARHHRLDELGVPIMAVASFFTAASWTTLGGEKVLLMKRLGAEGLFGALAIALASVHVQRLVSGSGLTIKLPGGAPDVIVRSFASIVPGFASVALTWLLAHVVGLDLVHGPSALVEPLIHATNHLGGVLALCVVDSGMWLLGVHPLAVMSALKPVWLQMIAENQEAAAALRPLPHTATREFFLWFVWQGGSGGTLAVALLLVRARSGMLKAVGKLGLVPAVFNINEPLLFGAPIVMNPRLAVPFLVAPLLTATTAYLAMTSGLVPAPRLDVIWTLPAPLGAYLTTGGSWRAVALQSANLGLAMLVWWPFLRAYDRALAQREAAEAAALKP